MFQKVSKISVEEARKKVSELIFKVLTNQLCVRDAIKLFPPDERDLSIQCAWHALIHYEADEDIKRLDKEYAEEQYNFLEMVAFTLRDGYPLPVNIIQDYNDYYTEAPLPSSNTIKGILNSLLRKVSKF